MNILQKKSNKQFRDALVDGDVEKARKLLRTSFVKPDLNGATESGGFHMLHCAALSGSTESILMLLQAGADIKSLTHDGYSALDIALWKGFSDIAELLRDAGCIAPIKEPDSLNGKLIRHGEREATVVDYVACHSPRQHCMRALHYTDGENVLVDLWAGRDYTILGDNVDVAALTSLNFRKMSFQSDISYAELLSGQALLENDNSDTDEDESVAITVPPGPLGVLLNSDLHSRAIVQGFTVLPNGQKGAIEQSGRVYAGMQLVRINSINASELSLHETTQLLGQLGRKAKVIRFASKTLSPVFQQPASSPVNVQVKLEFDECLNCGVPTSVHESKDCPYR